MAGLFTLRRLRNAALGLTLGFGVLAGGLLVDAWEPIGLAPEGVRLTRMQASPQWADGAFTNPDPMWMDMWGSMFAMGRGGATAAPVDPIPVVTGDRMRFIAPPATGLRITWLGHSTQVIEVDGLTVITDPIFGGRAAPFDWAGPQVWYPPPIPLSELPPVDAVLISHDHYDHLQMGTMLAMAAWDTTFIVPLGVGAHLEYWGIPPERIRELDWWDRLTLKGVEVVATPAHHASGRQLLDQNRTLWAGYALIGPQHRVYFSGDTGLFPAMERIGAELGPFDVTMIESGAYDRTWPDWHLGPEQAVRAHTLVRGELLLPVHWGLWSLAPHGWTEPVERVLVEAERQGVKTFVPRPGQSLEPEDLPVMQRWWPSIAWSTAAEDPILATHMDPAWAR